MGSNDPIPGTSGGTFTHHAGGATITTEWESKPVSAEEALAAMAVLRHARWGWPYLAQTLSTAKNGRETGMFIVGQVLRLGTMGVPGMRVEILEDHLAGVAAVLVASGITVSLFSFPHVEEGQPKRVALDVWVDGE